MGVFDHIAHTGAGQTIGMFDIFEPDAKGGSFYKTDSGWKCCGEMQRIQKSKTIKIVNFLVWLQDDYSDKQTNPKQGESFKLLVFQNNQWFEIIPTKVRLAFGGDKVFKPKYFQAQAWNSMIIQKAEYINLAPTDLIPVENG